MSNPQASRPNLALGKPAWQSSTSAWSRGSSVQDDAAGAVSGKLTGTFQFHTDLEDGPWWRVDLGAPYVLSEIQLYNRLDEPEMRARLRRFVVECSLDGENWKAIYTHDSNPIGGADGHPLVLRAPADPAQALIGRHMRIRSLERTWLHLDQVAIYGEPPPEAPKPTGSSDVSAALDDLIGLLAERIASPSQPPSATPDTAPPIHQPIASRGPIVLVACARWETGYILEWLLYHRSIGFDHVYLYCNDDDPIHMYGAILPLLQSNPPFVTFVHFPYQGQQFYMYRHFLEHRKEAADWIAFLDVDEFLCLPGLDDVKQYLDSCPPEWDAIHFNCNDFGNSFHAERPTGSVLVNYTRRAANLLMTTKALTRSSRIDLARINQRHRFWEAWRDMLVPGSVSVNVLGEPMAGFWSDGATAAKAAFALPEKQARIRARALVQHYPFKSQYDFKLRIARGLLGDFDGQTVWLAHEVYGGVAFLAHLNEIEDTYLADYWRRFLSAAQATAVVPRVGRPNLAVGKPARQSSVSQWSLRPTPEDDAAGAVSGVITGRFQFHTELEDQPWWQVDLGAPYSILEIRVYNRVEAPDYRLRLGQFMIECSTDGATWRVIYAHDGSPVGGADGHPLLLRFADGEPGTPICRHLRLTALHRTYLHLDQVEVYGEELRPPNHMTSPIVA